ncbi:MAG: hypothetical protein BGO13_14245 [Burkholderiales bacterium 66-5]|nr:MAG: hypothetical protein BGO13_14245 [Burkholderiales bacterium 66-5]
MFIQLEMGWMNHPFPTSNFRIASVEQIQILRGLGVTQLRYVPSKSLVVDSDERPAPDDAPLPMQAGPSSAAGAQQDAETLEPMLDSPDRHEVVQARCRTRFNQAASLYADVAETVDSAPVAARAQVEALARADVAELLQSENYTVHLLTGIIGQHQGNHCVNVMVLSLLLGRALGLGAQALEHLAAAGLLHDIGKIHLPAHIAQPGAPLSASDKRIYEEHVIRSVALAQRMGFGADVLLAIGQHHEMADGSGYPRRVEAAQMGQFGKILALVNRYDRLCNPLHGESSHTPHEALARLFAQERKRFDATTVLAAFIRLMGVYPPGSLVQLNDGRYARVVASNSQSPLRPHVLPFVVGVSRRDARVVDLGSHQEQGIRRSVKFDALSDEALEFFLPGQQLCYFFDRVQPVDTVREGVA